MARMSGSRWAALLIMRQNQGNAQRSDSRFRKKGFTVLEMIVALGIMVLILSVVLFRTRGISDQGRIETARGDLRALKAAIEAYYLNHIDSGGNHYLPSGSDWQTNDLANDNPRVIGQILYDPFRSANTQYQYAASPNGKYFVAFSYGPNEAANITGINDSGVLTGISQDDIFETNGTGTFS